MVWQDFSLEGGVVFLRRMEEQHCVPSQLVSFRAARESARESRGKGALVVANCSNEIETMKKPQLPLQRPYQNGAFMSLDGFQNREFCLWL